MSDHRFGLIELLLVFGAVIGWALWELWALKRDKRKTQQRRDDRGE